MKTGNKNKIDVFVSEIQRGESENLEFKVGLPAKDEKFVKTVCAFANSRGGKIIFGVDDKTKKIVGIPSEHFSNYMDAVSNSISNCCQPQIVPYLSLKTINDKTVLIVEILPGQNTPYYLKKQGLLNGTYVRIGATTRPSDSNKIKELILWGQNKSYDNSFEQHKMASEKDIKSLCSTLKKYSGQSKVQIGNLLGWKLLRESDGKFLPSVAFRLLANNDLPFAKIQCARFKGESRSVFIDRKVYDGTLFEQIENAYNFTLSHINLGAKIEGLHRKDVYEIPPAAIRELIVNAVMHRNYLINSTIQISIFDDRLEIQSPGGLYGGLTFKNMLEGSSRIRNEIIADIFLKAKFVEKWGTGILRVGELCRSANLEEPSYEIDETSFRVTIKRKALRNVPVNVPVNVPANVPVNVPVNKNLNETERMVLQHIVEQNNLTAKKMAEMMNVNEKTVKRAIAKLKEYGMIQRIGSDKSGYWSVLDGGNS